MKGPARIKRKLSLLRELAGAQGGLYTILKSIQEPPEAATQPSSFHLLIFWEPGPPQLMSVHMLCTKTQAEPPWRSRQVTDPPTLLPHQPRTPRLALKIVEEGEGRGVS